jgi:hypothetical protein
MMVRELRDEFARLRESLVKWGAADAAPSGDHDDEL